MQLNIEKHNFCALEGIGSIKNHLEKLNHVNIHGSKATGDVEINVSYLDFEGSECFKAITFPFELDLDELTLLEVFIGHVNVYLVEGQGLDIDYELVVNYAPLAEAKEIELIDEKEIELSDEKKPSNEEDHNENLDQIKEDMMEFYTEKLSSNLQRGDQVITTKKESVCSFLDFFDGKMNYYKLKCLYVESEADLETIAKEYHVNLEKLMAGYDQNSHKVLFSVDESTL